MLRFPLGGRVLALVCALLMAITHAPAVAAHAPQPQAHLLARLALPAQVARQSFVAPPGNYPFQMKRSADGLVVVHYYQQPDTFATQVVSLIAQALQHPIHDTLGFTLKHTVDIYVYNSRDDFLAGAGVSNPAETGAYAVPAASQIYLPITDVSDTATIGTLSHELTHIVFHQNEDVTKLQSVIGFYPLWLDEGLAAYDESVDPAAVADYASALSSAVTSNTMISLLGTFATTYPTDPNTDFLGYAEARSFITYLIGVYGPAAFHQFLAALRDGQLWLAATQYFHEPPSELQRRWELALGTHPSGAGYAPLVSAPTPFAPGTVPALASRTTPFPLARGASIVQGFLAIALLVTILMGIIVALEWLWLRGQRRKPLESDASAVIVPLAFYQAFAAPGEGQSAPSAEDFPGAATPTAAETPVGVVTPLTAARKVNAALALHWSDVVAMVAPPLAALGVGLLTVQLTPRHEWATGENAAANAGVCFTLILLAKIFNLRRRRYKALARAIGFGVTLGVCVLLPLTGADSLGAQQANLYNEQGAYALGIQTYSDTGQPDKRQLAQGQAQLAQIALNARDYATAVTHLRLALEDDPSDSTRKTALLVTVELWGNGLKNAGRYADAVQVFQDQAHAPTCADACQSALTSDLGATYRAWGDAALAQGDFTGAQRAYQILKQTYGATAAGANAPAALQESAAQLALSQAWLAGQRGNGAAMNAQLQALAHQYAGTAAASDAPQTPELVTGVIRDSSGVAVAGDRLFFLAFTNRSDAVNFRFDEAFTVATTLGAGGAFSLRLQPGYWYVPFWGDPSLPAGDVNISLAGDLSAFYLQPYHTVGLGTIVGF